MKNLKDRIKKQIQPKMAELGLLGENLRAAQNQVQGIERRMDQLRFEIQALSRFGDEVSNEEAIAEEVMHSDDKSAVSQKNKGK